MADVEENKEAMRGVNTSICEQLFSRLGRHKYSASKMGRAAMEFYLTEVADLHNRKVTADSRPNEEQSV